MGLDRLNVAEVPPASSPSLMAAKFSTDETGTDLHLETSFLISGLSRQSHGPSAGLRKSALELPGSVSVWFFPQHSHAGFPFCCLALTHTLNVWFF